MARLDHFIPRKRLLENNSESSRASMESMDELTCLSEVYLFQSMTFRHLSDGADHEKNEYSGITRSFNAVLSVVGRSFCPIQSALIL